MSEPLVHLPSAGETLDLGIVRFTIKADSEHTDGAYSLIEASGAAFAMPHVHHNREEAFYVVEGQLVFLVGDDTVEASAGAFLLVPRGTIHAFRANGDARVLIVHSPGGFETFFRESAAALMRNEFNLEFRNRLAERHGMTYHDDVTY
jgi:mannose-6-phosphate isomerase-like protein (cupin superfamily)